MSLGTVYAGTAVTTEATFTNPGSPTPVDPTTVTMKFIVGSGAPTVWTYGGAGFIVKVAVGVYSAALDTTDTAGAWRVEWFGTGACAVVNVAAFMVLPQPF